MLEMKLVNLRWMELKTPGRLQIVTVKPGRPLKNYRKKAETLKIKENIHITRKSNRRKITNTISF